MQRLTAGSRQVIQECRQGTTLKKTFFLSRENIFLALLISKSFASANRLQLFHVLHAQKTGRENARNFFQYLNHVTNAYEVLQQAR